MNVNRYLYAINITLPIILIGLLFFGTGPLFILAYIGILVFFTARTLMTQAQKRTKLYLIIAYAFVTVIQVVVSVQVIFDEPYAVPEHFLRKLFGLLVMLLPLIVSRFVSAGKYTQFYLPSLQEIATVSFAQANNSSAKIFETISSLEQIGKSLSPENVKTMAKDLPRHDSFRYINNGSLTEDYFSAASKTLDDPFIYVVISNTGSAASEMISVFTKKQYNHASISFDRDLQTVISYNGGERVYPPGLNPEMLEYFSQKPDASILVYRLACSIKQKKKILDKVRNINEEGSAYNMVGLVLKYSHKPNIMFCSQFVYKMLQYAELDYFQKKDGEVKPTDLIELDYQRKLEFDHEIKLNAAN